jgi:resuscitation-promoting factor RpfA
MATLRGPIGAACFILEPDGPRVVHTLASTALNALGVQLTSAFGSKRHQTAVCGKEGSAMVGARCAVRAALVLLVVAAGALATAAGPVAARSAAAVGAGTATLDDAVLLLCAAAGTAVGVLLVVGVLVDTVVVVRRRGVREPVAPGPGRTGAGLLPAPLHRLVVAAVGAGIVAGVAGPAAASVTAGPAPAATAPTFDAAAADPAGPDGDDLDPSWAAVAAAGDQGGPGTAPRGPAAPGTAAPGTAAPGTAAPSPDAVGQEADDAASPAPAGTGWRPGTPPVPADQRAAEVLAPTPRPGAHPVEEVVVRRGDSLWAIAARHLPAGASDAAVATEWPRWYAANRHVVGSDPDHLLPGQRLVPPPA